MNTYSRRRKRRPGCSHRANHPEKRRLHWQKFCDYAQGQPILTFPAVLVDVLQRMGLRLQRGLHPLLMMKKDCSLDSITDPAPLYTGLVISIIDFSCHGISSEKNSMGQRIEMENLSGVWGGAGDPGRPRNKSKQTRTGRVRNKMSDGNGYASEIAANELINLDDNRMNISTVSTAINCSVRRS